MASVRRRAGAWYLRYYDERGIHIEIKSRAASKTEARELAEDLERKAERVSLGLDPATVQMSFEELWRKYSQVAPAEKRSWSDIESRVRLHILPRFAQWPLHQIRAGDIKALMASKLRSEPNPDGLSPQTCNHLRIHMSSIFNFAIRELRVFHGENPARVATKFKLPEPEPRFFEADVVRKIIEHVAPQYRALFTVGVYTGMRKGELVGLKVQNVDMERRSIMVSRSYAGTTKAAKVRYVPIPDELVGTLEAQLEAVRGEYLFPGPDGGMLREDTKLALRLRTALRAAGVFVAYDHLCRSRGLKRACGAPPSRLDTDERTLCPGCGRPREVKGVLPPANFKDLRSTFCTHLVEQSGDLRAAQRILGHSDPRVTERSYALARDGHLLAKANLVSFRAHPMPNKKAEAGRKSNKRSKVGAHRTTSNTKKEQAKQTEAM